MFFFFFIYFYWLEANYFTTLEWVLSYIDMNQPWSYMYSPSRSLPPTSLSTRFLWVFPVHQARALVSCIPPGLVICFTIDNIHVVLLKHPTLAFSHRVQKSEAHVDWNIPGVKFRVIEYLGLGSFLKELNTIHQFVVFSSKIILAFWQLYLRQIFILLNQLKEKKLEPISVSFPEYVLIWGV